MNGSFTQEEFAAKHRILFYVWEVIEAMSAVLGLMVLGSLVRSADFSWSKWFVLVICFLIVKNGVERWLRSQIKKALKERI